MAAPSDRPPIRVLELYSGIGGMHCALRAAGISYEVVQAMDVNPVANQIYKHNFPETKVVDRGIEVLTVKDLERLNVDMLLMSPPCQPFTRVGNKKDTEDLRTKSFIHLLQLLPRLEKPLSYVLVENVKGFETSDARHQLVETLQKCGFAYQEMLLTPLQYGIPNSRLRYFLIGKRKPLTFQFPTTAEVLMDLPECAEQWLEYKTLLKNQDKTETCRCRKRLETESESCDVEQSMSESKNGAQLEMDRRNVDQSNRETKNTDLSENEKRTLYQSDSETSKMDQWCKSRTVDQPIQSNTRQTSETLEEPSRPKKIKLDDSSSHKPTTDAKETENNSEHTCSTFSKEQGSCVKETRPSFVEKQTVKCCVENYGLNMRQTTDSGPRSYGPCLSLGHFLECDSKPETYLQKFLLPDKDLKRFVIMDIVNPCSRKSICFTKRYGHFMEGAGSVIQMTSDVQTIEDASNFKSEAVEKKNGDQWGEREMSIIRQLHLRYFTPQEIAKLLCFPESFGFPANLSNKQLYRVLGNSLNVHVVHVLIKLMLLGDRD